MPAPTEENQRLLPEGRRRCTACGEVKYLSEGFDRKPGCAGGYGTMCKACRNAYNRVRYARSDKSAYHEYTRSAHLKRKYGISPAQRTLMYVQQNGCCAICKMPVAYDMMDTDHDHATGRVRGLLCRGCNSLVGYVETRGHLLSAVMEYLTYGKEKTRQTRR